MEQVMPYAAAACVVVVVFIVIASSFGARTPVCEEWPEWTR